MVHSLLRPWRRSVLPALVTLLVVPGAAYAAPGGGPLIVEPVFHARTFEGCADDVGSVPLEITHAICSPVDGIGFGQFVYYAVADPGDASFGRIERIDPAGYVEIFAPGVASPSDLALSATQNRTWSGFYLMVRSSCGSSASTMATSVLTPQGDLSGCLDPGAPFDGHSVFDVPGRGAWFFNTGTQVLSGDTPASAVAVSDSSGPGEILFGPGGAWGRDLYVTGGGILHPGGSLQQFPYAFSEWDWVDGPGWELDMFDLCGPGRLCRVRPDGTATTFALGVTGDQVVGCAGQLWIMEAGNCVRITRARGLFRRSFHARGGIKRPDLPPRGP